MMDDDAARCRLLNAELQAMKERHKDAIENKKKYEQCIQVVDKMKEDLDLFKRLTNYFLDKEGF